MLKFLITFLLTIFDLCAPVKTTLSSKLSAPWITDIIKMRIRERDEALQKLQKTSLTMTIQNCLSIYMMVTKLTKIFQLTKDEKNF